MNVIALMPPLSLIKSLKMFFCVTSIVQINFLILISYDWIELYCEDYPVLFYSWIDYS